MEPTSHRPLRDVVCAALLGLSMWALWQNRLHRPVKPPEPVPIWTAAPLAVLPPPPLGEVLAAHPGPPLGMVNIGGLGAIRPFYLDQTEVTAADYGSCGDCPQPSRDQILDGLLGPIERRGALAGKCNALLLVKAPERARHPMNCVTAKEAQAYCTARGKRLPTAAEWQLAAAGAERRPYPWGQEAPQRQGRLCWERLSTCEAGKSPGDRSPGGVLDLSANVQEWLAFGAGSWAHFRGGSWVAHGGEEDALRNVQRPQQVHRLDRRQNTIGFRCAADP